MDKKVTVKFFRITKTHNEAPSFEKILEDIHKLEICKRKKEVSKGVVIRLERFSKDQSFVDGEILRIQQENMPPEVDEQGSNVLPISDGAGLGHVVAFRYHVNLCVLAIQFDVRAVSMSRFLSYLQGHDISAQFDAQIIIKDDAWERYGSGDAKRFELEIAKPQNLAKVEGEVGDVLEASKKMAEIYEAPCITVTVSMGKQKDKFLKKNLVTKIIKFFTSSEGEEYYVKKLKVSSKPKNGEKLEDINFLQDVLSKQETLYFSGSDPTQSYNVRQNFLKRIFTEYYDEIQKIYGKAVE